MENFSSDVQAILDDMISEMKVADSFDKLNQILQDGYEYAEGLDEKNQSQFINEVEKIYDKHVEKFVIEVGNERTKAPIGKSTLQKTTHDQKVGIYKKNMTQLTNLFLEISSTQNTFQRQVSQLLQVVDGYEPKSHTKPQNKAMQELAEYLEPYKGLSKIENPLKSIVDDFINTKISRDEFVKKAMNKVSGLFKNRDYWDNIKDGTLNYNNIADFLDKNNKLLSAVFNEVKNKVRESGNSILNNLDDYAILPVQRGPRLVMLSNELEKYSASTPCAKYFVGSDSLSRFVTEKMADIKKAQDEPMKNDFSAFINNVVNELKGKLPEGSHLQGVVAKLEAIEYDGSRTALKGAYKSMELILNDIRAFSQTKSGADLKKPIARIDETINSDIKNNKGLFHQIQTTDMVGFNGEGGIKAEVKKDLDKRKSEAKMTEGNIKSQRSNEGFAKHTQRKAETVEYPLIDRSKSFYSPMVANPKDKEEKKRDVELPKPGK